VKNLPWTNTSEWNSAYLDSELFYLWMSCAELWLVLPRPIMEMIH